MYMYTSHEFTARCLIVLVWIHFGMHRKFVVIHI